MGLVIGTKESTELLGKVQQQLLPQETTREGIEVIRTFCSSAVARPVAKVLYGYAYRCIKCNGIWLHRVQSYKHECLGVTVLGV